MTEKAAINTSPSSNSISPEKPKKKGLLGSLHVQIILAMLLGAIVGGFFNYCGGSDKVIIAHSSFYKLIIKSISRGFFRVEVDDVDRRA